MQSSVCVCIFFVQCLQICKLCVFFFFYVYIFFYVCVCTLCLRRILYIEPSVSALCLSVSVACVRTWYLYTVVDLELVSRICISHFDPLPVPSSCIFICYLYVSRTTSTCPLYVYLVPCALRLYLNPVSASWIYILIVVSVPFFLYLLCAPCTCTFNMFLIPCAFTTIRQCPGMGEIRVRACSGGSPL